MKVELLLVVFLYCALALAVPHNYVTVPSGRLVHKSCIHRVESETQLFINQDTSINAVGKDGSVRLIPACRHHVVRAQPPHGRAWRTSGQYNATGPITGLLTDWTVPSAPKKNGALLYYWPGLEPGDNSFVLQPVLQFGHSPNGGGFFWAYSSWLVGDNIPTVVSTLRNVSIGDTMSGTVMQLGNNSWSITANTTSGGLNSDLTVNNIAGPLRYAYGAVLESYRLFNCNFYPTAGKDNFFDINVAVNNVWQGSSIRWTPLTWAQTNCKENTLVNSPSSLTITFDT